MQMNININIQQLYSDFSNSNGSIISIPAHQRIQDNEKVDITARDTLNLQLRAQPAVR